MSESPDFLVHIPPGDLRGLLDVARDAGHAFTEGQAAADLALDLDRLRHPNPRMRLRKLHSRRFYAQRWGWTRAAVQEAFAGDARRGVEPWIEARAGDYLDRFRTPSERAESPVADSGGHFADSGGQKQARTVPHGAIGGHSADSGGHSADKEEQFLQALQREGVREHAREGPAGRSAGDAVTDRPRGAAFASAAVVAYRDAVGTWPPVVHAEAIALRLPDPDEDELREWAAHVTTYAVSSTRNARNVPGIIQTFDEHLARKHAAAHPAPWTDAGPAGRNRAAGAQRDARDRRQADIDDPAGAHERNLAAARAALGR